MFPATYNKLQSLSDIQMNRYVGLLTIVGGLCLVFAGLLIYTGWLSWFGRLPGDIHYESDHVQVYVPIVSMLIVSVVLSVLFYLLRRFF
jgi:membrane protein implicated in regulation of membrane protease activity